jgi:glycosyltransferase involved in cell wall biosynthesis
VIIAFIITGLGVGGAETMLLKLLQGLDRRHYTPHVVSLTTVGELGPRIAALGIPVHAMQMRAGLPSPFKILALSRLLKKIQPTVVHTWMYHADLIGGIAARLAGVSAVAWCIRHSNLDSRANKRSTLMVAAACARLSRWVPRRILLCSDTARRVHIDHGYDAGKMRVIPNGFDLAQFQPDEPARVSVRQELGLGASTPLVGMVGRLDPQKNHAGFLAAMGLLHRKLPQVHFLLAGQGVDDGNLDLADAAREAGILPVCHFLGRRGDMPRVMAALDVLASASIGEAFPNVVGEAMASGVPCAVTDVGDCAYIVGDTGRVVPPGDPEGLSNATASLLVLPVEERSRLGQEARARVRTHFEISHVVTQYQDFFDELAAFANASKENA